MSSPVIGSEVRPPLIVLQPTSLCNLDCGYCYVEDRRDARKMETSTLSRIADTVAARFAGAEADVVFHSGEPLTVGLPWFHQAVAALRDAGDRHECRIAFGVQTNGVLVDDRWAEFFALNEFMVGVSLDGPADIHDRHRRTLGSRGSHSQTVAGIAHLHAHDLDVNVLAVVTPASLGRAHDIYAHFKELGIRRVGFNPDDSTGVRTSTLVEQDVSRYEEFLLALLNLVAKDPDPLRIREFVHMARHILAAAGTSSTELAPDVTRAWRVISFDREGNFGTFSPEIMSAPNKLREPYVLGNVEETDLFDPNVLSRTNEISAEVDLGVARCRESCEFFTVCGGGTPSSKLFELGTLDGTETVSCRLSVQALTSAMIRHLQLDL